MRPLLCGWKIHPRYALRVYFLVASALLILLSNVFLQRWQSNINILSDIRPLAVPLEPKRNDDSNGQPYCNVDIGAFPTQETIGSPSGKVDATATFPDVIRGGEWKPNNCASRNRLAIVIPYRDRPKHLRTLLGVLHPLLKMQEIHYRIFVAEQITPGSFNKGMLMNIAFSHAQEIFDFDCVIFHDVDLVPSRYTIQYACPESERPRHMTFQIKDYSLNYETLIGGVLNIPRETFIKVNGFSNLYWGWGAEDDDMYTRFYKRGIITERLKYGGMYIMLDHESRQTTLNRRAYAIRKRLLKSQRLFDRSAVDGLTTIPDHAVLSVKQETLYTHFSVEVGSAPIIEP